MTTSEPMPDQRPLAAGGPPQVRLPGGDARARVTGRYPFAVDRRIDGALHAAVVRSPAPHGLIRSVGASDALSLPGVLAVIDGAQLAADERIDRYFGETRRDQPVLADGKVRYVGEPVAVVVAESRAAAEQAARRVDVEIDPLPAVTGHDEAGRPGAPLVHDDWPGNECGEWRLVHGDAERAVARAAHVHTATYRSPPANHAAMEPHVATAAWLPDGSLEVWTGTQSPYAVQDRLMSIFRLPGDRVRVRGDNLGGGFGSKLDLRLEGIVAVAARATGRPVRLEIRRDEVFLTAAKHAATVSMTTGLDADGIIIARIIDIAWNAGAYAITTPRSNRTGMIRSPGPYRIPNVLAHSVGRYTNTVPTGPFRGAMTGQVCWAHECAMDEIAAMLGIDPVELRRRNVLRDGDLFATGEVMRDLHYKELIDAVSTSLERGTPAAPPAPALSPAPAVRTGKGIALVLKSTRTPSRSEAMVQLDSSGRITVRTSSVEMGQGASASLAELAAAQLSMSPAAVSVSQPDTAWTPFDSTTSSSRTTFAMGLAVEAAAADLRRCIDEVAMKRWQDAAGVVHEDGSVRPPDTPESRLTYAELVAAAGAGPLVGHGCYQSPEGAGRLDPDTAQGNASVHWHQGAVGVEVAVDVETGRVTVTRAHGATYAGRVVSAARARKQTEGGMIFGLGQALMEDFRYDGGEPVNTNLSDYPLPSVRDAPAHISSTVVAADDAHAEPHGIGESTVPPMAPAVAAAVFDAVGVRVRELPLTAERLLRAIRERDGG